MTTTPPDVLNALEATRYACALAARTISDTAYDDETHPNAIDAPSLNSIRVDFLSILSLIRAHSTTLAMALKPPPTFAATSRPLTDLKSDLNKLVGSIHFLATGAHGSTLYKSARTRSVNIVDALQSLIQTFVQSQWDENDRSYLLRMGSLHSAIDEVKEQFPLDNRVAVLKLWKINSGCLSDALLEYEELATEKNQETGDERAGEDDGMDTWDDFLEIDSTKHLSPEEQAVAKKCWNLARMVAALHERIRLKHLKSPQFSDHTLDALVDQSSILTERMDDLTISLYSPQNSETIRRNLSELSVVIGALRLELSTAGAIDPTPGSIDLEGGMQAMRLTEGASAALSKDSQWLRTCFTQIQKSIDALQ